MKSAVKDVIVFLHGGGVSGSWSWSSQTTAFADYTCLTPDLPGHGQRRDVFEFARAVEEVTALLEAQPADASVYLIGLSLGAQVALQVLANHPKLLARALLTGCLCVPYPGSGLLTREPGMTFSAGLLALYMPLRNAAWLVRANMRALGIPMQFFNDFSLDTARLSTSKLMSVFRANSAFRVPDNLAMLETPVLALAGTREVTPIQRSLEILEQSSTSVHTYRVRGANHNWNLERPDKFNQTLRAWLRNETLPIFLEPVRFDTH